jgi:glycosyltransferase involved in cell wall biosynthesis
MKIAVEALGIHFFGGGRTATLNLLEALFALDRSNQYRLFLTQPEPSLDAANVEQKIVPVKNRFMARIWAQLQLPRLTRDCNLTHFIKNLGAFGLSTRTVVTVYDLTTLLYPELFPKTDVWYWRNVQKRTLQAADRVIAISEQTARDIQSFYGLPKQQIKVIYPACGRHFRPASAEETQQAREKYCLPADFILHVGRIDPKKNIPLLIEAFAEFRRRCRYPGILLLVGEQYKKQPDLSIYKQIEELALHDVVRLAGVIPDADLPALYTAATMSVSTSVHEGFGLAPLEAMACGAPLVVNQAGAVVEVVGDAARIMPESTSTCLAAILERLWQNPAEREALRQKGFERAAYFSWEESARQTLLLYQEAVEKKPQQR